MAQVARPAGRRDFEIAIICALTIEADAVEALFDIYWDDEGPPYDKASGDPNAYSTGYIGRHNIVLAHMPGIGKVSAAAVTANCSASFPNIKLALVVGVCGVAPFVPGYEDEIVLGDVIISDGVVQYDLGQRLPERFVRKDTLLDALGRPNTEIRSLLAKLKGVRGQKTMRSKIASNLDKLKKDIALKTEYPGVQRDRLFEPTYRHVRDGMTCEECGCSGELVRRRRLEQGTPQPAIYFGLIASSDTVMKAGEERDVLVQQENVIGFEMEGAGVWDRFPCVVIKGACDYADSHKAYAWQNYAAATAAACAKAFLDFWVPSGNASQQSTAPLCVKLQETKLQDIQFQDDRDKQCLKDLFVTDPRDDKMRIQSTKGGLLTDAYCWILEHADFRRWRHDEHTRLLWVKGDPGKGKTMLLCGIIDELQTSMESALLSYFFCQTTDSRINNATSVLRGLISMLIFQRPSLVSHIRGQYDIKGRALFEDVNAWMALSGILTDMLQDPSVKGAYVVIDALDECTVDLQRLLKLIVDKASTSSRVKWIVSSRNWPDIEEQLNTAMRKVRLCLELSRQSVSAAVGIYIEHEVDKLARLKNYDNRTRVAVQEGLLSNANDTFLWVSLVCHELAEPKVRPWHTLAKLRAFPPGLDALYRRMLDQISTLEDARICRQILAVISKVYRPITLYELTSFVDMPDGLFGNLDALEEMIKLCGSFLTLRDNTLYFVHQSAKDFLLEKASQEILPPKCMHYAIFSQSLQVMSSSLRNDVYGLGSPGSPVDGLKEPEPNPLAAARYSCVNWVKHLCDCDFSLSSDDFSYLSRNDWLDCQGETLGFLREHFLHWIEALSLTRTVTDGVLAISSLESRFAAVQAASGSTNQAHAADDGELLAFIQDAKRFVLYNRSIIEEAPLQIYSSALIFTPQESIVRRQFEKQVPSWIKKLPAVSKRWSQLLQTFEGHTSPVTQIAFDPDGKLLASACKKTIRLWAPATGACIQTLASSCDIGSLAFTADARMLSSLYVHLPDTDTEAMVVFTVKAWDIAAGTSTLLHSLSFHDHDYQSRQRLRALKDWVGPRICALSPDGKSLAVTDGGNSIDSLRRDLDILRLWDIQKGTVSKTLIGHSSHIEHIGFSPDSKWIVSSSEDGTLRLWDMMTGACSLTIARSTRRTPEHIAVSENGRLISSMSFFDEIYVWDTAARDRPRTLNADSGRGSSGFGIQQQEPSIRLLRLVSL
ncbi:hypothetical protein G6O67_003648 [Ophiocordyceps sinensis]|uniref:NACHT domain-containing protein n=1 Tax=Ophiocordyceps sinensis TaxID=72228 RepID=A0A8H4PS71_9HYPO|nr:hypothetical protein G6O67_003648 [Ophiocordyceps sinensis]